jgi:hypothetical protein
MTSITPIFLEEASTATKPEPTPTQRSQDMQSRLAYLAGLANDADFAKQVLNGSMKEDEEQALRDLEACPAALLVEKREHWRTVKAMRQAFADALSSARLAMSQPAPPPEAPPA